MAEYGVNLFPAILIGVIVGLVVFSTRFMSTSFDVARLGDWFDLFLFMTTAAFAAFSLSFSILDFLVESDRYEWGTLLSNEFENGRFGLRVASVIIGVNGLIAVLRFTRAERLGGPNQVTPCGDREVEELSDSVDPVSLDHMLFSQYGIYVYSITGLWIFSIMGRDNTAMAVLGWALFFIVDDWAIIYGYVRIFKGRILLSHRLRLVVFNLFISILLFGVVSELSTNLAVGVLLLMLALTYRQFIVTGTAELS